MSEKADVKSSRMQKGRKTINYLQKLKDEGTPIVQMCPGPRDQFWTMAAEMADVDCILFVRGKKATPEMLQLASENNMILLETCHSMYHVAGELYCSGLVPVY